MTNVLRKFLINTSGNHLGVSLSEDDSNANVIGDDILDEFLDVDNCLLLSVSKEINDNNERIRFTKEINNGGNIERVIIYYKIKPCSITEDNFLSSIYTTSLHGSITTTLYHVLTNVFAPSLIQKEKKNPNQTNIERQLTNLQLSLRSSILTPENDFNDESALEVIASIDNEVEYWHNATNNAKNRDKKVRTASYRDILTPLVKDFSVLDALPLLDVEDTLESAHNVLDDLWRHEAPYPKNRIEHLMDIIACDLHRCILKHLTKSNIWKMDYNEANEILLQCISATNKWRSSCRELTEIFWPNYSLHMWNGKPYVPQNLNNLVKRLEEILTVRTTHRQLTRLLTINEQEDLKTNEMLGPFSEVDITQFSPKNEQIWKTSQKQYEYLIQPAEQRVAIKLKKQFGNLNANTRQLLHEFGRYSELINRPILKQSLLSERQYLLSILQDYILQLVSQMTETPTISTKYDTPQVVSEILTIRQLEAKVNEVKKISDILLNDLKGYVDLNAKVTDLAKDLKQQHQELFDSWTSEITDKIKDSTLSLKESDPVVKFTSNSKLMKVTYSPRLVTLISEVRQLTALGYRIPSKIEELSAHAKRFITYAKILEQIANFHNTIGDRMLPSQRPMMLSSALELSHLVQEQEVVSWGDEISVEKYVKNLQKAVEKLSSENNLLTAYHAQIVDLIKDLESIDLLKYYQKWKDSSKTMREIMDEIEQKGFESMHIWKTDIDKKLCEALKVQYIKSLDTIHLYLPQIYTELVYRDNHLQYSPEESILEDKYDQQLKRFLEIPKSFRGVSDNNDVNVFAEILTRCEDSLNRVKSNTENLFRQLNDVRKHWESWLTIGVLDVTQLKTWQHWDIHFRSSKTFGQEIAKLPSTEERVGCFIIGLSRLRSDLESHNRSYWDQLTSSLKNSIAQDIVRLQQFIDPATLTLNKPLSLEQIDDIDSSHSGILQQNEEMSDVFKEILQKANILSSWTREKLDSVSRLSAAWERLQSLLENHQHIIAKQIEIVKTTLNVASENLNNEIERFAAKWEQVKPRPNSGHISNETLVELQKHLENIREKHAQWLEIVERKEKLVNNYKRFLMEAPEFPYFDDIDQDLNVQEQMWKTFEEFYTELELLNNEEWIVFRKKFYKLDEFIQGWQNNLQKMETTPLVTRMLQEIHKYQTIMPVLKYMKGDDFTDKHWMEIFRILRITPKPIDSLNLKDFLSVSDIIVESQSELQAISKKASSEVVVRQALNELDQWEVQTYFVLIDHVDSQKNNLKLIKDFKDILNKIGDQQSLLQSVKNSSDYESFSERASLWENKLNELDQNLTSLSQIQRKWIYLEPIFGSGTLEHERARFYRVDRDFRNLMKFAENDSRVCALCRYLNLNTILNNLLDQLSRCQSSLDKFLYEKREKFPRFLFIGDDDLLEIVGQSSKENIIQAHLKKLFSGIHTINLDDSGKFINEMCSTDGEIVRLLTPIDINHPVEEWLNALVYEMQSTLKTLLGKCLAEGQSPDPLKYPSQILCLANNIHFTTKCEQALNHMNLTPLLASYKTQLNYYSSLDLSDVDGTNQNATDTDVNVLHLKLKALLLDTIHHINVIEHLLDADVNKANDWMWQKQLRFYTDTKGDVLIKMVNATTKYSFEYLGNAQKLVRTPLTDKCFLTLMQGMHLGMGGNPYGPAGTGKTESIKELGSLLGRQVLVFNCDEGIDASAMGRILCGLVQSGAWGCFDEFNRLDEATLSTISMYIQAIQNAIRTQQRTVNLLNQQVQVNKNSGIFVTLNPAGGGYGGRNKLPDNLKQLFRPVVMTHPDHEQIARTLLHCDGYQYADVIGRKLVEMFDLCSKLLSKQQHYDWGLRALRTVLSSCGQVIKKYRNSVEEVKLTLKNELSLVTSCIKIDTLSKLTYTDGVKFDGILKDVFPEAEIEENIERDLIKKIEETFVEMGLPINQRQVKKCLELYGQLKQRMGVAIVGPASSGKTTIRKVLFNTLIKLNNTMKQYDFNPKSMQRNQLLGHIDLDTRQWSDGVLTLYSLQVASETQDVWSWIVCDGDIDPEWVESLNSVMDDNKLLSLPSGWRIQFGPNVNFIFETHDLSHASPATISRMGIVFISEEDLKINDYVIKLVGEPSGYLSEFISDYFIKAIDWIFNEAEIVIPCSKLCITRTGLSFLRSFKNKTHFTSKLINGLIGLLANNYKELFAQFVFELTGEMSPPNPMRCKYNYDRDMLDSYYTNQNQELNTIENGLSLILTGPISQTVDCLQHWLKPNNEKHFILVGPHGSGKSLIIEHVLQDRSDCEIATIYCSANVTPSYVIYKFTQHCLIVNSNKGRVYRPNKGHLILHFKNLHLLKNDKWGTNVLIEFIQQLINNNGFFDTNLEWVGIVNITVIGTLESTNYLSQRFTSIVNIYNVELPSAEDLYVIYLTYLNKLLNVIYPKNNVWSKPKTAKLTNTILAIYNEIKQNFNSIENEHYTFNLHDITKWCNCVKRYKENTDSVDLENWILEVISQECLKIFGDRLVTENEKTNLHNIINNYLQKDWGKSNILKTIKNHYYISQTINEKCPTLSKINEEDWIELVNNGIKFYERDGQHLELLIIKELLHLTSALNNTLTFPGGSIALIGRNGVGRRSSLKITSALQSAKLIIPLTNTQPFFNNDLKLAMQYAGIEGEQVYLLIEDHILSNDAILNNINILLYSGEIPELYKTAELESIVAGLRDELEKDNFEGSLVQFFTERIKRNLHIILCLEMDNSELNEIFTKCPAINQNCSMIWMSKWSNDTLETVPNLLINKRNKNLVENCNGYLEMQNIINAKIATPLRFIYFINTYIDIYMEKKNYITKRMEKLQAGVSKLTDARNIVDDLKVKAVEQQAKLEEKQSKANAALDMISNTMKNANNQKQEIESLKSNTETENEQLIKRKKEIEIELSEVEPLIQEARSAVGNIKNESLSEIRSLRAPPEIIRDILEGVLRLMGIQDTSWNSMKTFLAKRGVKEDIRCFDASKILPENRHSVEKLISTKSDSFDPKSSKRASVAAAPLAAWVLANVKYAHVLDKINPLEKEQNRLQQNLRNAELHLGELSSNLSDVDATVAKLKAQLSTYTKEAAEIEINLAAAQETLVAAEGLINKLNDEYERWQTQLKEFSEELKKLSVNCLLSAAFITYLSNETEEQRTSTLKEWIDILSNRNGNLTFNLEEFLSTERERLQWQSEGISGDKLSLENVIILLKATIFPLIVDPTLNAFNWLKKHHSNKQLEVITQNSSKFITTLELAVRFGKILIIEEVEHVSPVLYPILRKQFTYQGERKLVNLNGKMIDYNSEFNLIFSSRNENIQLNADVLSTLNVVNFKITVTGLSEQLLNAAIRQENATIESRRKEILRENENMQEKLYNLQNQLLEDLINTNGDILQDKKLLLSLNETKASSNAITISLNESNELQIKLQNECDIYVNISTFGSILYFATNEFSKLNVLYSLSVASYIRIFLKSLSASQVTKSDLSFQKKTLLYLLYQYVGKGIFKKDRIKFMLHIVHKIYPKQIPDEEWSFFLGHILTANKTDSLLDNLPNWLKQHNKQNVISLMTAFPSFYNTLQFEEEVLWKTFMQSKNCEENFPTHIKPTEFQKLLIIQAIRPDRLYSAMCMCVIQLTSIQTLNIDILKFSNIYMESSAREPILLLITSGNDPSNELTEYANQKIGRDKFIEISMGEGQECIAVKSLQESAAEGYWLVLKNIHLVTLWLPILTQTLAQLDANENFRLWLITEPHQLFNPVLARNCLKVAYEPPEGIKNNLLRTFNYWGANYTDKLNSNTMRIFYSMACIHALLQERRTYIPQGWLKPYEFSSTDFSTILKLTEEMWNTNTLSLWKYLIGLSAEAIYGGRIDNDQDLCVLMSYLEQYFSDTILSIRWKPFNVNISLPTNSRYEDYVKVISQLSNRDLPSYFGLAPNIERAWEKNVSTDIINDIKDFQLKKVIHDKVDKDLWQKNLTPFLLLWRKLNQGLDFVKITVPEISTDNSPMKSFINNEFRDAIILLQTIHRDFTIIHKIIKGQTNYKEEDYNILKSLLKLQTPNEWLKLWDGTKDPTKYLRSALNITSNLFQLLKEDNLLNKPINLSLFLHPDAFLSSFKQHIARQNNDAIDELVLHNLWKSTNNNFITLSNLLIEGALFDGLTMTHCTSESETINNLPNSHITWMIQEKKLQDDRYLKIPLYVSSDRDKLLGYLKFACEISQKEKWIQTSVAVYLNV